MASEDYNRLIKDLSVDTPGAMPSGIEAAVFATVRDFLQKTNAWTQDFDVILQPNVRSYVLALGLGQRAARLMNFYTSTDINKRWLLPATMQTPGTIVLGYTPSAAVTMSATLSLYVVDLVASEAGLPYTLVPSWILYQYHDTLFCGALARLFLQPLKPYTNPTMASARMRMYNAQTAAARSEVLRQNVWASQRWSFPQSMAGGRQLGV